MKKQITNLGLLICVVVMALCGCGEMSADNEAGDKAAEMTTESVYDPVALPIMTEEDESKEKESKSEVVTTEENQTNGIVEDGNGKLESESSKKEQSEPSDKDTHEQTQAEVLPQNTQETNNSSNNENQDSETTQEITTPTATLNGRITSVGNDDFTILKASLESSQVMVSNGDEKVKVSYTDSTKFILCSSSDGGITTNYTDGSASLLGSEKLVEIIGTYEGDIFKAQKVTVFNFG